MEIFKYPRPPAQTPAIASGTAEGEEEAAAADEAAAPEEAAAAGAGEAPAAPAAPPGGGRTGKVKKSVDDAAHDIMEAMNLKAGVKAAVKAKAKAEAKAAAAAGKPDKGAEPPKVEAAVFKGMGCACDETARKQVTCRFGKGPGSTKAYRYGAGTGLTAKQALAKGEEWLKAKRAERDKVVKAIKKE